MKKSGFTLIELIFVIVIIGLLAAVAVPKFLTTKKNAETANLPSIGNQIVNKANEQYNLVGVNSLQYIIEHDRDINNTLTGTGHFNTSPFNTDYNASEVNVTYNNHLCLKVERVKEDVNISSTAKVSTYNFTVTELNTSCNAQ